jgi:DNA repair protein RadD
MTLALYQQTMKEEIYAEWNAGKTCVAATMATGLGKSYLIGDIVKELQQPTTVMAHRAELVGQLSMTLASNGVRHALSVPPKLIRSIVARQIVAEGRSFYDPSSAVRIASVQSLATAHSRDDAWLKRTRLWIGDECHHFLLKNIWGRAVLRMPNARGLGVTATPNRADGKGIGSKAEGFFDTLVEGPQLGEGIDMGFLVPYELVIPGNDVELSDEMISPLTGDFNQVRLRETIHKSPTLVGNVVKTWQAQAAGRKTIVFVVDIEEAVKTANAFKAQGIRAEAISSHTPDDLRDRLMQEFRRGNLLVLVNVDLFGEGVDIPAVEVVVMARPTASLGLFIQICGRALRLNISSILRAAWHTFTPEQRCQFIAESPKPLALIIDHVGNVVRHRPPCDTRVWTLESREKRSRTAPLDAIPLTSCLSCFRPISRELVICPHCGHELIAATTAGRTLNEVDGDMVRLNPSQLRELESAIRRVDGAVLIPNGAKPEVAGAITKRHRERQFAQRDLRDRVALWAGYWQNLGEEDRVIHKRFFLTFKIGILEAMALGTPEALALLKRIQSVTDTWN